MREYTIDKNNAGIKCFNFVKKLVGESIKNSDLFKIIRKGVVRVNEKKKDYTYVLQEDDVVTLYLAEEYFNVRKKSNFPAYKLNIVFENDDVLVINKKRGVLVHSDGIEYRQNLVEYVKGYLYRKGEYSSDSLFTPTFCNRLDFNTSGIVVAAKNQQALQAVTGMFRKRTVDKRYYAIVHGEVTQDILVTSRIEAREDQKNKMKCFGTEVHEVIPVKEEFLDANSGLSATVIRPLISSEDCSLVSVELWTGKKHQIRAHCSSIAHPLLGDLKYFNPTSSRFSQRYHFENYFLHSYYLDLNVEEYGVWDSSPNNDFIDMLLELFPHKEWHKYF